VSVTRREALGAGGGLLAVLCLPSSVHAQGVVEIRMQGRTDGSLVWFDPIGVRVEPGQTIRWINLDPGNSHTATAYHPGNQGRPRRMPANAPPWDSGYLLPNEMFAVTLTEEGVYDYCCVPHEHAGMVGRIVVGRPPPGGSTTADGAGAGLPEVALRAFPSVDAIMRDGFVRRARHAPDAG
jgi:plastocyanin